MNVSLTPQLTAFVRRKVDSGLYGSASEVVRDALRLMEERDRDREERLLALRDDIAATMKRAVPADHVDPVDMFDTLKEAVNRHYR